MAGKVDLLPGTVDKVARHLRKHILPAFGAREFATIQPADVRAWVAKLSASGLAPDTVKAVYLTFGQVMHTAEIDRLIVRTPCVGIKLPKATAHEQMHFLTAEQVTDLAEAITRRFRALIYTAAYAGLRAGKIGALRVERLNLLKGTVEVVASLWEGNGQHVIGPAKSGKRRTLTIPHFLTDMLGEHLAAYPSANGHVFTSAEGATLRHRNFYDRHFKPAVNAAGAAGRTQVPRPEAHLCGAPHRQRAPQGGVKDYLGHSTIRVTSDRYGHLFSSAEQALAGSLDATFVATSARTQTDSTRTLGSVTPLQTRVSGPQKSR